MKEEMKKEIKKEIRHEILNQIRQETKGKEVASSKSELRQIYLKL